LDRLAEFGEASANTLQSAVDQVATPPLAWLNDVTQVPTHGRIAPAPAKSASCSLAHSMPMDGPTLPQRFKVDVAEYVAMVIASASGG
jgi:hypothetical protein